MMDTSLKPIDHKAIQVSQVMVILLNILAFVLNLPYLAMFTGLICLVGAAVGVPGFLPVFKLLKSASLVKPEILPDHPEPHRFAQFLGGLMTLSGGVLAAAGQPLLGWALVWIHAALAALNGFGGFCVGCFMYYWLNRLGVPGFHHSTPPGVQPGMRPKEANHDA